MYALFGIDEYLGSRPRDASPLAARRLLHIAWTTGKGRTAPCAGLPPRGDENYVPAAAPKSRTKVWAALGNVPPKTR
jgi:hypothetical protein